MTSEPDTRIVDVTPDDEALIDALVPISLRAAAVHAPRWLPTPELARAEIVRTAAAPGICRALVDGGVPRGWAGAAPSEECAWELHPLLVDPDRHGGGLGRRLVADVERLAGAAGALTMELSTTDATCATTLGGVDLFADPLGALSRLDVLDASVGHAFRFWQKAGYAVVGVLPDAEGQGVPSIRLAKSLRNAERTMTVSERVRPGGGATRTRFVNPIIFVDDVRRSRHFYRDVIGLPVRRDRGDFVLFEDGFAIHDGDALRKAIRQSRTGSRSGSVGTRELLLYFEHDDIDALFTRIEGAVDLIHPIETQSWGQRVFRFLDPDRHAVEIGEPE